MFDKDKRAILFEAVFACGLIAIGIPTGQVPLVALAASAAGIGSNWAFSLADRGFQHWCDGWFTDEGVLNYDIQKALCEAFVEAVKQLEHDWMPNYKWLLSQGKTEEAESTLYALRELRKEESHLLLQPKQQNQGNQHQQLTQQQSTHQTLLKQVEENHVLSFLYQRDEFKASEALKSALRDFLLSDDHLYTHNNVFVTFVTEQLGPKWLLRFVEILKDQRKGTPVWRACQLLWQKSLMSSVVEIKRTTDEMAFAVRWLQEWGLQLKNQPSTQCDPIVQEALEKILHSVQSQLDKVLAGQGELLATANRTEKNTEPIADIDKKTDLIPDMTTMLEEIRQKVIPTDLTPHRLWTVPYLQNPYFTGREVILEHIREMLSRDKVIARTRRLAPPLALSGLGGVGKTQIAVEYAYRFRNTYRFIFWMSAVSREMLIADFAALADVLHLPEKQEQDQMIIVVAIKRWLEIHDQWLLIFDNADDLKMAYHFLPTGGTGHILLTTRAQATGSVAQSIEVEKMERQEGTLLLLRRARVLPAAVPLDQAPEKERANAEEIVAAMDGLPLALDQAGAYIEETGCSLSGYLNRYRQRELNLLNRRGEFGSEHPDPVATTWSLSFEQVEQQSAMAANLLRLCAFLFADAIPEEMIFAGATQLGPLLTPLETDHTLLDDAIAVLRRFSLVARNNNEKTLSLHRLVQVVLRGSMNEQTQHEWAERTVRAINQAFPDVEFSTWSQCARYLPHALACTNLISQYTLVFLEAGRLLNQTADYLYQHVLYAQAEPLYVRALTIYKQQLGPQHLNTATILDNLAALYNTQSKYEQAEHFIQQALAIKEQQLGPQHPETATSLNNLAALYQEQGLYAQAEPLYVRALTIYEQQLGPQHLNTATGLDNLARLYNTQGKYEQAKPLAQRALAIREQQVRPQHPDTAKNLNYLAALYQEQGLYEQAEPLLQHALAIDEQQLGPQHPDIATILENLVRLYYAQGKYEQAEPLSQRALAIREQQLGPQHPSTAKNLNNLARLYYTQGKYEQAKPLTQRALAISEQQLGPQHPETAASLNNLALLYDAQGQYEQAEPLYMRALAIREQQLGPQHPDTASSLNNLAALYDAQERYAEAEPLYVRALAIREQQLGPQHPDTASSRDSLARLYNVQGKYEQAEPLYVQTLAINEQRLGSEHLDTASSLYNLSGLYYVQGKYEQAEPLLQHVLLIREKVLGTSHSATQTTQKDYAILLQAMGRDAEAKKLEERS